MPQYIKLYVLIIFKKKINELFFKVETTLN